MKYLYIILLFPFYIYGQDNTIKIESYGTYIITQKNLVLYKISDNSFMNYKTIGNAGIFYGDGSEACIYVNLDTRKYFNISCYVIDNITKVSNEELKLQGVLLVDPKDWYEEPYETKIVDHSYKNIKRSLDLVYSSYKKETFKNEYYKKPKTGIFKVHLYNSLVTIDTSSIKEMFDNKLKVVYDKVNSVYYLCLNNYWD